MQQIYQWRWLTIFALVLATNQAVTADDQPGIVSRELIYADAPFPQCHASTIEETPNGLVAAWFGGTHEKHPDVGIWVSRHVGRSWTTPVEVTNGVQYTLPTGEVHRHPTWNPVLFQYPDGPLLLFYKSGPSPSQWWGEVTRSTDGGKTCPDPTDFPSTLTDRSATSRFCCHMAFCFAAAAQSTMGGDYTSK